MSFLVTAICLVPGCVIDAAAPFFWGFGLVILGFYRRSKHTALPLSDLVCLFRPVDTVFLLVFLGLFYFFRIYFLWDFDLSVADENFNGLLWRL